MDKFFTSLFLILFTCVADAQIMSDREIDETKISPWVVLLTDEYEGVFFFGMSEGESQLTVSIDKGLICVQVLQYKWVKLHNGESDWRPEYTNYTNVRIEGNKFFSMETNGEFVMYQDEEDTIKGLKLLTPPIQTGPDGSYEIGAQGEKNKFRYFSGKFINTKFEILSNEALKALTLQELKVMRNEIYARYGYIFKHGGEMNTYFIEQDWYTPILKDVTKCLTEIEKANIKNIEEVERHF